jgi:hypothetical protein
MPSRLLTALLGVALAVLSCSTSAASHPAPRLRVDSYRVERDVTPGRNKVVGHATNTSNAAIRTAGVRFNLYDATGKQIGVAQDYVHDLQPGQAWTFHAKALGNVSRAKLSRLVVN